MPVKSELGNGPSSGSSDRKPHSRRRLAQRVGAPADIRRTRSSPKREERASVSRSRTSLPFGKATCSARTCAKLPCPKHLSGSGPCWQLGCWRYSATRAGRRLVPSTNQSLRAASYRASAGSLLVRPNGDGEQPRDTLAAIVRAVASAVLHDDITGLERDFGTVIEFETNDSFKHNVVVDRRRAVHPRFVRVGPWRKRGRSELT